MLPIENWRAVNGQNPVTLFLINYYDKGVTYPVRAALLDFRALRQRGTRPNTALDGRAFERFGSGDEVCAIGGRQRLDADQRGPGADDDRPRSRAFLRRPRPREKRAEYHDAQLRANGRSYRAMGHLWL